MNEFEAGEAGRPTVLFVWCGRDRLAALQVNANLWRSVRE